MVVFFLDGFYFSESAWLFGYQAVDSDALVLRGALQVAHPFLDRL